MPNFQEQQNKLNTFVLSVYYIRHSDTCLFFHNQDEVDKKKLVQKKL